MARNSNKLVVPGIESALDKMKLEIANELGIPDYNKIDRGALPSRINGMIGGSMTKRLIELGQQSLANGQVNLNETSLDFNEYKQEALKDLQNSQNLQ